VKLFELDRIDLHIDGGWGVDALLGRQTRTHADLDIAVNRQDVAQIRFLLDLKLKAIEY
jgi:lincosamide nucleotidyltransferase A/C/D/E